MYPNTDVVLVCFSVDSKGSLQNVKEKWIEEVRQYLPKVWTVRDIPGVRITTRQLARCE
jgi:GTPase SAR1 family protein